MTRMIGGPARRTRSAGACAGYRRSRRSAPGQDWAWFAVAPEAGDVLRSAHQGTGGRPGRQPIDLVLAGRYWNATEWSAIDLAVAAIVENLVPGPAPPGPAPARRPAARPGPGSSARRPARPRTRCSRCNSCMGSTRRREDPLKRLCSAQEFASGEIPGLGVACDSRYGQIVSPGATETTSLGSYGSDVFPGCNSCIGGNNARRGRGWPAGSERVRRARPCPGGWLTELMAVWTRLHEPRHYTYAIASGSARRFAGWIAERPAIATAPIPKMAASPAPCAVS